LPGVNSAIKTPFESTAEMVKLNNTYLEASS